MNEDERGITPAGVTSMTIERDPGNDRGWWVIIEQGNGDLIKDIKLTELERLQLATLLGSEPGKPGADSVSFTDFTR